MTATVGLLGQIEGRDKAAHGVGMSFMQVQHRRDDMQMHSTQARGYRAGIQGSSDHLVVIQERLVGLIHPARLQLACDQYNPRRERDQASSKHSDASLLREDDVDTPAMTRLCTFC